MNNGKSFDINPKDIQDKDEPMDLNLLASLRKKHDL
jgi:hypothetical protein